MSDYIDIPTYPKNMIKIGNIQVRFGTIITIDLNFTKRTDCLEAVRFLTEIIDNMIDHSYREKE